MYTKDEQRRVDVEKKLKKTMPEGWSFEEGDVFARLKVAGIEILPSTELE